MKSGLAPHLVLGLRSDADPQEATTAFARAVRRTKVSDTSPFTVEELTAALSQIENRIEGRLRLEYTVPANPEALKSSFVCNIDGTVLTDRTEVLAAGSAVPSLDQLDQPTREVIADANLAAATDALLTWKWAEAEVSALEVLRFSNDESCRDEALNVAAAAMDMQGHTEKGIGALTRAVQGEWNLALQCNLGILAIEHDRKLAIEQISFLVAEATTQDDRVQAINLAMKMWRELRDDNDFDQDLDSDSADEADVPGLEVPPKTLAALKSAFVLPLPADMFWALGNFLINTDREWIADQTNWARSPNVGTVAADLVVAREQGFSAFADLLVEQVGSDEDWINEELDELIEAANTSMLENESSPGAAAIGFALLDKGLDARNSSRVLLRALVAQELALMLHKDGDEPNTKVITWFVEGREAISDLGLSDESASRLDELFDGPGKILNLVYLQGAERACSEAYPRAQIIYQGMATAAGRRNMNIAAVRDGCKSLIGWSQATLRTAALCAPLPSDAEIDEGWDVLKKNVAWVSQVANHYANAPNPTLGSKLRGIRPRTIVTVIILAVVGLSWLGSFVNKQSSTKLTTPPPATSPAVPTSPVVPAAPEVSSPSADYLGTCWEERPGNKLREETFCSAAADYKVSAVVKKASSCSSLYIAIPKQEYPAEVQHYACMKRR